MRGAYLLVNEERRESNSSEIMGHSDELGYIERISRSQDRTGEEAMLHELFCEFVREILVEDDYPVSYRLDPLREEQLTLTEPSLALALQPLPRFALLNAVLILLLLELFAPGL